MTDDIELDTHYSTSSSSYKGTSGGNGNGEDMNADDVGNPSQHSSIRSIASRMRSVGRVLFRANTCLELITSWFIFVGYTLYWVIFRSLACLYLVSDCPGFGPFLQPACRFPAPLGSNTRFRPLMLIAKVLSVSCIGYLIFLIVNLAQLEITGRYRISASCVLTLTKEGFYQKIYLYFLFYELNIWSSSNY